MCSHNSWKWCLCLTLGNWNMTQMALGKSCLWQRQLPRADLWCLNHYAILSCCNHFAICYVPWCFRTLEIVVWFNVFGVVCGLLETWSIMFPEGARSEVEKGVVFHYRLSKMNLWKISSDSHLLWQVKDQLHPFKRTSRVFFVRRLEPHMLLNQPSILSSS